MGFFSRNSPQVVADHPPPEGSSSHKSRWFSSSKMSKPKNRSPLPSSIDNRTHPTSSPTLPSRSPSALPPSLSPSPHVSGQSYQPRLSHVTSAYPSTSYARNDSSFPTGSGKLVVEERYLKGKAREDDRQTLDLAGRLAMLAASHADGLLGDDEYRDLRQAVFAEFINLSAASSTGRIPANDASEDTDRRFTLRTPTPQTHLARAASTISSSHSSQSRTPNLGSLFRSSNNRTPLPRKPPGYASLNHSSSVADAASLFSTSSSSNGRIYRKSSLVVPSQYSSSRDSIALSQSGSQASSPGANRSIRSDRPASIISTLTHGTTAPPSAYNLNIGGTGRTGRVARQGEEYSRGLGADATPVQFRREIEIVEAERRGLLETFSRLEEEVRKGLDGHDDGESAERRRVKESEDWTHVYDPSRPSPFKQPAPRLNHRPSSSISTIRSSTSFTPTPQPAFILPSSTSSPILPTRNASQSRNSLFASSAFSHSLGSGHSATHSSLNCTASVASSNPDTNGTSRHIRHPSVSSSIHGSLPVSLFDIPPSRSYSGGSSDPEMVERQRKLLDVQRKKQDTADRYLHRLEFLRQKLRAAEIKEKAMR